MIIGHAMKSVGLFILKTMIIGHRMKLLILMPGGSGLPSPDTAARKKYVTWILLATERSRRRMKREKQKHAPYKIYSLHHS
jgi:hypothetical protein